MVDESDQWLHRRWPVPVSAAGYLDRGRTSWERRMAPKCSRGVSSEQYAIEKCRRHRLEPGREMVASAARWKLGARGVSPWHLRISQRGQGRRCTPCWRLCGRQRTMVDECDQWLRGRW